MPATPVSPTPPSDWYPDPAVPGTLRYWNGSAWTEHTAPMVTATAPARRGMSGGAIAGIVVGSVVLVLFIIGVLSAIAVPVFLEQKHKASDASARDDLRNITVLVADAFVDDPNGPQSVTARDSAVEVATATGVQGVELSPTTTFGGYFTTNGTGEFCVWAISEATHTNFAMDQNGNVTVGSCPIA